MSGLRERCTNFLSGHAPRSPAEDFAAMAIWCAEHSVAHDTYGEGGLIQAFERKIADLLGFEAAVFVATGTLTQVTALRLACAARGSDLVALHPTAHILRHERGNHQLLGHFKALAIGDPFRCWTAEALAAVPDRLGAALYELPMREIGGQLPSWDELAGIKALCAERDIHLHMDGARLWEAVAGYGRSPAEIAAGFDSVYVSFYKGIGALGGAMLLGSSDFVALAAEWFKRQGGQSVPPLALSRVGGDAVRFTARADAGPSGAHPFGFIRNCARIRCFVPIRPHPRSTCCTSICR